MSTSAPLLFLAHRLPYPPNKGDKVRSFHFLRHLARRRRVFLGTFVDDPADWEHVGALREICAEVFVERISPRWNRVLSARAFLSGEALTLPYFRSRQLSRWVRAVVAREHVRHAFAFSSPMAQYVLDLPDVRSYVDFVDMDSAKWGEYARRRKWPISAIYRREARRLFAYERQVAARARASIFVTDQESALFRREAGSVCDRVTTIRMGVNSEFFSAAPDRPSPFASGEKAVVFTGAMDYWPNIDAVVWFAREILPEIRRRDGSVRFYIVGMNPDAEVRALAEEATTVVTGRVDDVRPYLQHAHVVVAPLRIARGIQSKVLEAMAMSKAVVVTAAAASALTAKPGVDLEVATDAPSFVDKVASLLESGRAAQFGARARARVLGDYSWSGSLSQLDTLLEADSDPRDACTGSPATDIGVVVPVS